MSAPQGRRIAIAVKPSEQAEKNGFVRTLKLVAAQTPRSFADQVVLLTEQDLPRDVIHNAKLLHAVRRDPPNPSDDVVRALIADLQGRASIGALVEASGIGANAFRALVRLIGDGTLTTGDLKRITYQTTVARVAPENGHPRIHP